MINYYRDETGTTFTMGATATMNNGKFDVLRSARWHKLKYTFVGDFEVLGDEITLIKDGEE